MNYLLSKSDTAIIIVVLAVYIAFYDSSQIVFFIGLFIAVTLSLLVAIIKWLF